jgi:hypothetical protein
MQVVFFLTACDRTTHCLSVTGLGIGPARPGLEFGLFCGVLHSVLLFNAILRRDLSGRARCPGCSSIVPESLEEKKAPLYEGGGVTKLSSILLCMENHCSRDRAGTAK